ncbi:hypothetical protein GGR53DRAFT_461193 [Hypoxylon sp. FL1150]|nr:hypothetical protein GGR53DRAFT_461193 [Hypoxylon sp. FL1150]
MPVTELILLPLNPAASEADVASAIEANTKVLLSQGALRVRRSPVLENSSQLRMFVDWEDLAQHAAFAANDAVYGPFRARMGPLVDFASPDFAPPYHAAFAAYPPPGLDVGAPGTRAGVAELTHAYFPADVGDAERAEAERTVERFAADLKEVAEGFTGELALGWSVEDDIQFEGQPSRVLVGVLGWESLEAHKKASETEGFAKVMPALMNLERLRGMKMCHVQCITTERES